MTKSKQSFSLNASYAIIFVKGLKGQRKKYSMFTGLGSFTEEHKHFFLMFYTNFREQDPRKSLGSTEMGENALSELLPWPLRSLLAQFAPCSGGRWWHKVQNVGGWLNETWGKKWSRRLSFEEVSLVRSSEWVGKKGASASSNLSHGDPGGQIGNPVHNPPPLSFVP